MAKVDKKVAEAVAADFEAGQVVVFKGYADPESLPDNSELLEEGQTYEIASVNPAKGDNEASYNLQVENPEFNEKKRESSSNPRYITVDVFADEIEVAEEEEEEVKEEVKPAAKRGAKAKAEEAAPAKGRAKASAKETKAEADELDFAAVEKGETVTVVDADGTIVTGIVLKKSAKSITVEDSESGDPVTFKEDEIESLTAAEEVAAKEPPKEKTVGKKGASKTKGKLNESKAKKETKAKKEPKPPKEEEDEDLKGMLILSEEEEDEEILKLVEDSDIIELAEDLAQESADVEYKLGGILYHVRKDKVFREIQKGKYNVKGGFEQYVTTELKIGYRKAMYLIDIYTKFNKFGLDPDSVKDIGWTKAMVIAGAMDEDNAQELLDLAKKESAADLKDTIKESYSKKGEDNREVVKKTTFKFRLVEASGAIVQEYIEQAAQQKGFKKLDDAFEAIVTEWASEHLDVSTVRRGKRGK